MDQRSEMSVVAGKGSSVANSWNQRKLTGLEAFALFVVWMTMPPLCLAAVTGNVHPPMWMVGPFWWVLLLLFPRILHLFGMQATAENIRGLGVATCVGVSCILGLSLHDAFQGTSLSSVNRYAVEAAVFMVLTLLWTIAFYRLGLPPTWRKIVKARRVGE